MTTAEDMDRAALTVAIAGRDAVLVVRQNYARNAGAKLSAAGSQ
jgi:hypothetical protein